MEASPAPSRYPPELGPRGARVERLMEPFVLVAALLTIPLIAIQESHSGGAFEAIAEFLNWATWLVFATELVLLLAVVPDRKRYLRRRPLDLVIVVLSPPVLPASLQGIRAIRSLRLLRLLRLAQLSRDLFSLEGLRYASVLALLTVIAGGASFVAFERHAQHLSTWDGVYWAVTTMTTLGSNIEPTTVGAKIVSVVILLVGISFVAMLTGAIAQRFLAPEVGELEAREAEGETDATAALRQMRTLREQLGTLEVAVQRLIDQDERGAPAPLASAPAKRKD
jgi:voltage-gated potassium channel